MSGLAKIALNLGAKVSGSDEGNSTEIKSLKELGVVVNAQHKSVNILDDIDLVVYTSAIKMDNPELITAKALGIKTMERAEFLGAIASKYKKVIGIAGTHGKTTTTAMIGEIFAYAGFEPTIHIGGNSVNLKNNTIIGGDKYFIVEACEYKNSFRHLKCDTAIITNIELDHLDYYKDYGHLHSCIQRFAKKSNCLVSMDNVNIIHKESIAIGEDFEAKDIHFVDFGYYFDVYYKSQFYASIRLNMLGKHNITNSLFAIATATRYGIKKEDIIMALAKFNGVERRYELIGRIDSVPIIIDYAHHPTEIDNSLSGIAEVYKNPLIVFQPHTYSRTLKLFDEFIDVLSGVHNLIVYKTYPAREDEIEGGRAEDLAMGLEHTQYISTIEELHSSIKEYIEGGCDAVVILGAGDLAVDYKKKLNNI